MSRSLWPWCNSTLMSIQSAKSSSFYKQKVAASFSRAAATYDDYATFQEAVLQRLMTYVATSDAPERWLDLGTGTGRALPLFQASHPCVGPVAVDLSCEMLLQARQKNNAKGFVCADAESLPFASEVFDGVFSSLALQWCLDQHALFKELHRVTKMYGSVVFATLLKGSMPELKETWRHVDGRIHHNQYSDMVALTDACKKAGFDICVAEQDEIVSWYPTVREAVYSLKKVGASILTGESSRVSPSTWRLFERCYENKYRHDKGIPLSYCVAFIRLKKVQHG